MNLTNHPSIRHNLHDHRRSKRRRSRRRRTHPLARPTCTSKERIERGYDSSGYGEEVKREREKKKNVQFRILCILG